MKYLIILIFLMVIVAISINQAIFGTSLGAGFTYIDTGSPTSYCIIKEDDSSIDTKVAISRRVVSFNFDSRFIIATRIVYDFYTCKNKDQLEFNTYKGISVLEYSIIDKNKNYIYVSRKKESISIKLQELKTELEFDFSKNYLDILNRLPKISKIPDGCKKENRISDGIFSKIIYLDK